MSKRLQVLLSDQDYSFIEKQAKRAQMAIGEWVRQTLRKVGRQTSVRAPEEKLASLKKVIAHSFPTADIDQILKDIDSGLNSDLIDRKK